MAQQKLRIAGLSISGIGVVGAAAIAATLTLSPPVMASGVGNVTVSGTGKIKVAVVTSASGVTCVTGTGRAIFRPKISGSVEVYTVGRGIIRIVPVVSSRSAVVSGRGSFKLDGPQLSGYWIEPSSGVGRIVTRAAMLRGRGTAQVVAPTSAVILNTATGGHGQYTNYPFTDMFRLGSDYYGVNSSGVYRLSGLLDDATEIPWIGTTGVTDFGARQKKYAPDAYIHLRQTKDVNFRTIVDEQKDRGGYVIEPDDNPGLHRRRVKLAKGLSGTDWQISVDGVGSVNIGSVEVIPLASQRC